MNTCRPLPRNYGFLLWEISNRRTTRKGNKAVLTCQIHSLPEAICGGSINHGPQIENNCKLTITIEQSRAKEKFVFYSDRNIAPTRRH